MKTATTLLATLAFATMTFSSAHAGNHQGSSHKMDTMKSTKMMNMSSAFKGIEVNGGTVSFSMHMGAPTLTVSKDFSVPKSPAPHWQIVDGKGNVYLLNQFRIAGDKTNLSIQLPKYITSIAKVQVWCSFAEVVLGEASFASPIKVR